MPKTFGRGVIATLVLDLVPLELLSATMTLRGTPSGPLRGRVLKKIRHFAENLKRSILERYKMERFKIK